MTFIIVFAATVGVCLFAFALDEPVDLTISSKTCLGGKTCIVGETLSLNVKLNQDSRLIKTKFDTELITDIPGLKENPSLNFENNTEVEIPITIPVNINEGQYELAIDTSFIGYSGIDSLRLKLKHLFFGTIANTKIDLRYPKVEVKISGYKCLDKGYYIDKIEPRLIDDRFDSLSCKYRIYVDEDTTPSHPLLIKEEFDDEFDYYETEYSNLDKIRLEGDIQKINFKVAPDTEKTNARVVPICKIENSEVEVLTQIEILPECKVNKK